MYSIAPVAIEKIDPMFSFVEEYDKCNYKM